MRRSIGTALIQFLRRMVPARLTNRYRPERHYMRGPGPKSRGRGGQIAPGGEGMAASLGNGGKSPRA
jgi:hypothetical protein